MACMWGEGGDLYSRSVYPQQWPNNSTNIFHSLCVFLPAVMTRCESVSFVGKSARSKKYNFGTSTLLKKLVLKNAKISTKGKPVSAKEFLHQLNSLKLRLNLGLWVLLCSLYTVCSMTQVKELGNNFNLFTKQNHTKKIHCPLYSLYHMYLSLSCAIIKGIVQTNLFKIHTIMVPLCRHILYCIGKVFCCCSCLLFNLIL